MFYWTRFFQKCALDTYNWFTFVVFHLAEDSRLSWCFIEHDFFSRSVILRIDKYPKNQFMFTVPGQFLFFSIIIIYIYIYIYRERERFIKKNNNLIVIFILKSFISSYLKCVLEWNLSARGTLLRGWFMQSMSYKFQERCECINI